MSMPSMSHQNNSSRTRPITPVGHRASRSVVVLQSAMASLYRGEPQPYPPPISEIYDRIAFAAVGKHNEFRESPPQV